MWIYCGWLCAQLLQRITSFNLIRLIIAGSNGAFHCLDPIWSIYYLDPEPSQKVMELWFIKFEKNVNLKNYICLFWWKWEILSNQHAPRDSKYKVLLLNNLPQLLVTGPLQLRNDLCAISIEHQVNKAIIAFIQKRTLIVSVLISFGSEESLIVTRLLLMSGQNVQFTLTNCPSSKKISSFCIDLVLDDTKINIHWINTHIIQNYSWIIDLVLDKLMLSVIDRFTRVNLLIYSTNQC